MPWIIDHDVEIDVYSENLISFDIIPKKIKLNKKNIIDEQQNSDFIDFYFTNNKIHMIEEDCGIIEKGSYMYTIAFTADEILLNKILEFYDK